MKRSLIFISTTLICASPIIAVVSCSKGDSNVKTFKGLGQDPKVLVDFRNFIKGFSSATLDVIEGEITITGIGGASSIMSPGSSRNIDKAHFDTIRIDVVGDTQTIVKVTRVK